jgi:hypothetical protein
MCSWTPSTGASGTALAHILSPQSVSFLLSYAFTDSLASDFSLELAVFGCCCDFFAWSFPRSLDLLLEIARKNLNQQFIYITPQGTRARTSLSLVLNPSLRVF